MKKRVALILAFLMVFALVAACDSSTTETTSGGGTTTTSSTPSGSSDTGASSSPSTASAQPSALPEPVMPDATGTIGWFTDEVDHFDRDTYDFAYVYSNPSNLTNLMTGWFERMTEMYNFNLTTATANGDANLYVNNIVPAVLATNPDGLIIDMVFEYQERLKEILDDSGVPYIALFNSVRDESGNSLVPSVIMNHYLNGQKQTELMHESRLEYWGEIDTANLGLIALVNTVNADLVMRQRGSIELFEELYPGSPVFEADSVTIGAMNAQAGYELVSAIIAGNPQVTHWFITSCVEDMSIGTARATEALGRTDSSLITGSGSSVLPGEWEAGYEGNWIGNFAVSNSQYAVPAVMGLIALADGRATPETLWEELKRPGDIGAMFVVGTDTITRGSYQELFAQIEAGFGF